MEEHPSYIAETANSQVFSTPGRPALLVSGNGQKSAGRVAVPLDRGMPPSVRTAFTPRHEKPACSVF